MFFMTPSNLNSEEGTHVTVSQCRSCAHTHVDDADDAGPDDEATISAVPIQTPMMPTNQFHNNPFLQQQQQQQQQLLQIQLQQQQSMAQAAASAEQVRHALLPPVRSGVQSCT